MPARSGGNTRAPIAGARIQMIAPPYQWRYPENMRLENAAAQVTGEIMTKPDELHQGHFDDAMTQVMSGVVMTLRCAAFPRACLSHQEVRLLLRGNNSRKRRTTAPHILLPITTVVMMTFPRRGRSCSGFRSESTLAVTRFSTIAGRRTLTRSSSTENRNEKRFAG